MEKHQSSNKYTFALVKRACGLLLSLLSALFLLSPSTHMDFLAYGGIFAFGIVGFYAIGATVFVKGIFVLLGKGDERLPKRFYFAIPALLLGLALLFSDLSFKGVENAGDPMAFLTPFNDAFASKGFALLADARFLGGFPCYELSGLLAIPGRFLPLLVASLLLLLGLLLCFFPLLSKAFLSLRAKAAVSKARRPERQQKKREIKTAKKSEESLDVGLSDPDYAYHDKPTEPSSEEERLRFIEEERKAVEEWSFRPSSELPFSSRKQYRQQIQSTPSAEQVSPAPVAQPELPLGINRSYRGDELQEAPLCFPEDRGLSEVAKQEPISAETLRKDAEEAPILQEELKPSFSEQQKKEEPVSRPIVEETISPSFIEPSIPTPAEELPPFQNVEPSLPHSTLEEISLPFSGGEPAPSVKQPAPTSANPQAPEAPKQNEVGEEATPLPVYRFPTSDMLEAPEDNSEELEEMDEEAKANMEIINSTLQAFSAGAEVVSYKIGPSVTRFDVKVNPDIQVSSLSKYELDISSRLAGLPTRYVPIVPKKTTSGFEIGNSKRATVSFKEMFDGLPKGDDKTMVVPFGKSIDGELIYGDLSGFPHMLVAGTTGSGKSVFIHSMLLTLLMRNRPEDLRLVMVDPKLVEFTYYDELPNLLCPIITKPEQAKVALDKLADLMDRRFELMSKAKVRDIRGYNNYYAPKHNKKKLPFIVVVVDEFADLAMQCKDIAAPIQRLGQKARAAGIHMIIATQRPDAQTISGTVKSNLPTTVCLMVKDYTSSQVVLKQKGGEQLLNHGDMLIDCPQLGKSLVRCQGCFVNENTDLRDIPDFIRSQQGTNYDPEFMNLEEEQQVSASSEPIPMPSAAEQRALAGEDKYEYIKSVIMTQETTSISQIQRNFSVGFPRAGKIVSRLQKEGIIAAQSDAPGSSKGLRVLVHAQQNPGGIANGDTPGSSSSASTSYTEDIDL